MNFAKISIINKVLVICLVVGMIFSHPTSSQPSQPDIHDKKVYINEQENSIYWPMGMPFWIRLATSPEPGTPSHLLKHVVKGSELTDELYAQEGIKLEIPGQQYVRWHNYITKGETLLKFFADGNPPETSVTFKAPSHPSQNGTFYGKGLRGTITATDTLSGVEQVFTSINGQNFVPYVEALSFPSERDYQLRYYAVDKVGYASDPISRHFTVDLTPPMTLHEKLDNFVDDTLSVDTLLHLKSKDELAGTKAIYYKFDNQKDFQRYSPKYGIAVDKLEDGEHTLSYYAVDHVDNAEPINEYLFYLDHIPPVTRHTTEGDFHAGKLGNYISPRTRLILEATDNTGVVTEIQYKINRGNFTNYKRSFAHPHELGPFNLTYRATDRLKNVSPEKNAPFIMDPTTPKSDFKLEGNHYSPKEGIQWLTSKTQVSLTAKDDLSGVESIEYQIADGPVQTFSGPIVFTKEGRYPLQYRAMDQVSNEEKFSPLLLIVDNTPPPVHEAFSIAPLETVEDKTDGPVRIFPPNTTLFLTGTDSSSGLKYVRYSINDKPMQAYDETLVFTEEGKYKIKIQAADQVDNMMSKTIVFQIVDRR